MTAPANSATASSHGVVRIRTSAEGLRSLNAQLQLLPGLHRISISPGRPATSRASTTTPLRHSLFFCRTQPHSKHVVQANDKAVRQVDSVGPSRVREGLEVVSRLRRGPAQEGTLRGRCWRGEALERVAEGRRLWELDRVWHGRLGSFGTIWKPASYGV